MRVRSGVPQPSQGVGGSLPALLWTFALGIFWMLIEFLQILLAQPLVDVPTDVGRLLRYLPWQLAIFGGIGVPLAAVVRWMPIRAGYVWWLRFGIALLAFLGPAVALGVYRASRSPATALAAFAAVAIVIALFLALLEIAARALPSHLRDAWPSACVIGMSFVVVPMISRASAPLRVNSFRLANLPSMMEPGFWIAGLIAGVAALATVVRVGGKRAGAITALGMALVLGGSEPSQADSTTARPDVLVILVDTLRADVVAPRSRGGGSSRIATPNFDAIASEGIFFERAYSAANRTAHAMPALMTSLSAAVVGESIASISLVVTRRSPASSGRPSRPGSRRRSASRSDPVAAQATPISSSDCGNWATSSD